MARIILGVTGSAAAREADLAVVAPVTANTIARIAAGWKTSAMSFSVPSTRDTVGRHKVDAAAARISFFALYRLCR